MAQGSGDDGAGTVELRFYCAVATPPAVEEATDTGRVVRVPECGCTEDTPSLVVPPDQADGARHLPGYWADGCYVVTEGS